MISDLKYPFHLQSQDNQGFHALPAATSGKKSEVFPQLHSSVFSVHSLRVEWAIEWVAGRGDERRRYLLNSRHVPRKVLVVILCGISLTARSEHSSNYFRICLRNNKMIHTMLCLPACSAAS